MRSRCHTSFAVVIVAALLPAPCVGQEGRVIATVEAQDVAGIRGEPDAPLVLPTDVAAGQDGNLFVVDSGNDRVVVFDSAGAILRTIGESGDGVASLSEPVGMAVDRDGNVYVADRGNRRLQIYSEDGGHRRSLSLDADGDEVVPVDVAVAGSEIFVTAANLHEVLVYDEQGALLRRWGGQGDAAGEFFHPASIVVASGRVYVVDVLNARVQVFDPDGGGVSEFGRRGAGPGTFFRPKGIVIDAAGRVFVSDSYFGVVQVFDAAGEFLHALGDAGAVRRFDTPVGMAIRDGQLAVVEMLGGRVQLLAMETAP